MKNPRPIKTKALLWWVAIISLVISGAVYYALGENAEYDPGLAQTRLLVPLIGIIISGICIIMGTAERWFQ